MFGRKARLPSLESINNIDHANHTTKTWITYLNHYIPLLHKEVKQNILKSQARQQKYFNR
ncbi:hypothetical protein BD560DRAFT_298622, partial [Blakeslea trispora]